MVKTVNIFFFYLHSLPLSTPVGYRDLLRLSVVGKQSCVRCMIFKKVKRKKKQNRRSSLKPINLFLAHTKSDSRYVCMWRTNVPSASRHTAFVNIDGSCHFLWTRRSPSAVESVYARHWLSQPKPSFSKQLDWLGNQGKQEALLFLWHAEFNLAILGEEQFMRELYLFLCQVALGCMCIFTGRARGRTHMHIFLLYHTQTRIREDNVCKCKCKTSDSGMLDRRWPQKTIMFVRGHNSSQNQRTKDALTAGLRVHKMANALLCS